MLHLCNSISGSPSAIAAKVYTSLQVVIIGLLHSSFVCLRQCWDVDAALNDARPTFVDLLIDVARYVGEGRGIHQGNTPPWNVVMKPTLVLFPAVRVWRRPLSFDFVSGPALPGRVLVTKGSQRKFPPPRDN